MSKHSPHSLTGAQIRQSFTSFFAEKGHTVVPSSSLVPDNDPTLMFTNSGMAQFKNNFTGVDTRLKRAVSVQKCVRAGGKHNDLDNIGHTARHHTFFEMLGNFSFGDYFKEQSITWGWEWVTKNLALDPSRLCVTIHTGDDEAFDIWHKKIGLKKEDIIRLGDKSNFWTMGDTGPCGPSSEIFYDLGADVFGGRPGTPEEDGDRWMEIWNHVFTQFDLQKDGTKVPLKNKNIDTGAGLERIMCAVQGVKSNYDTDIFQHIISAAGNLTGTTYKSNEESDMSLRVIADHLRAMTFLMVDGVMPSNEGRGYVLRRIMRRAMRHGHLLGVDKPFIHKLVPTLVGVMGEAYPDLQRGAPMAADVIKMEEERFGKTLTQGLKLLEQETRGLKKGDMLEGEIAFKLYDTYGFPLDLTQDALKAREISVNDDGFQAAMAEQKQRARAAFKGSGDSKLSEVWYDVQAETGPTEFLGYSFLSAEGVVQALVADGKKVNELKQGEKGQLVTNQTPFYAESGGQVGDTGTIEGDGFKATVTDTQKVLEGVFIHHITVEKGTLKTGANIQLHIDTDRRAKIARNHSATHLLFAGLREILGSHVVQRGSRQDDKTTRFDFSHPKAVSPEEIRALENKVNNWVWQNLPVVTRLLGKDEAVASGATAQFGEKYGDEVRVVSMGNPDSIQLVTSDLCGGTHVAQTGEVGLFRITAEGSVAAGIRRLEAVTHQAAFDALLADADTLRAAAGILKSKPSEVPARIEDNLKKAKAAPKASAAIDVSALTPETVNGITYIGAEVSGDADALRTAIEKLKDKHEGVFVLVSHAEGKATLVAGVSKSLVGKYQAPAIVNAAAATLGGKGGGRPDMANAGAPAGDMQAALKAARAAL
ncbi:MAG TPA: alanine--tRNA ligase [Alphaproteobacteria bacterium]|nr:alanine--tRNA ligase [Alphaproteobacteria bacterium]